MALYLNSVHFVIFHEVLVPGSRHLKLLKFMDLMFYSALHKA